MAGNKYHGTQKFQAVDIFIKYILQYIYSMLQYEIHSPLPSNTTAQQDS